MTFLLVMVGLAALILLIAWLGSGDSAHPQAPDTALSQPGSVGRDYGPLTPQEFAAHEEELRDFDLAQKEATR
jgi:hypothetical protein